MAAGDLVQKGTTVITGLNGVTYGTLINVEGGISPKADVEEIKAAGGHCHEAHNEPAQGIQRDGDLFIGRSNRVGSGEDRRHGKHRFRQRNAYGLGLVVWRWRDESRRQDRQRRFHDVLLSGNSVKGSPCRMFSRTPFSPRSRMS